MMDRSSSLPADRQMVWRLAVSTLVLLLGTVSFCCCLAAEFKKAKAKDIELDAGSLCSLPERSSAFELGIAAAVCLSIAQIVGTSLAAATYGRGGAKNSSGGRTTTSVSITLLVLSWVAFGLAGILLGTGSSMNDRQAYGKGWLDGECYVVKSGVYIGAAVLSAVTVAVILGFIFTMTATVYRRTGPEDEETRPPPQV